MNDWIVYSIGLTAQLLFSARLILQWLASEKQEKIVTPGSFWIHSLAASFLLFIYGYLRSDFAIMLGQVITYFIYIRNIQLRGEWKMLPAVLRYFLLVFPFMVTLYYYNNSKPDLYLLLNPGNIAPWLLVLGITGQVIFTFRFILQWIYSERQRASMLPLSFWYCSLAGSALILTYAVLRRDPVLFIGQLFGFVVYGRNIMLAKK
jgi:lipid-A-disaccharide synthase-like uncharacterized protein